MIKKLKNFLLAFHRDDRGAMSAEFILIVALIAIPILILLAYFRNTIIGWFKGKSTELEQYNQNTPTPG